MAKDFVITVSTHDEGYIEYFRQSCKRHCIEPVFLGRGAKWKGFGTKFDLMKDWINTIADEDRVLIVDCYDVIFLRPLETLFDMFGNNAAASGNPELFMYVSSEPYAWPFNHLVGFHYGLYKDQVVNSGSIMAHGKLLKTIFNDEHILTTLANDALSDDQQLLIEYLQKHPEVNCELDQNRHFIVHQKWRIDIGGRCTIKPNGEFIYRGEHGITSPYLLHRNGNGCMTKFLQQLGYDIKDINTKSNYLDRFINNHIPYFLHNVSKKIKLN